MVVHPTEQDPHLDMGGVGVHVYREGVGGDQGGVLLQFFARQATEGHLYRQFQIFLIGRFELHKINA